GRFASSIRRASVMSIGLAISLYTSRILARVATITQLDSRRMRTWLAAAGIVLIAVNLRPTITSLGALLDQIQDDTGMSGVTAGIATTMPVLAFATVGAAVPLLVKRAGLVPSVLIADAMLASGLVLRA